MTSLPLCRINAPKNEFHRICKPKAKIIIRVPFFSAWGYYNDPTHVRFFSPFTFDYFKKGTYSHEVNCNTDMFEVKKVVINYGIGRLKKLNWLFNPFINFNHELYCRFFAWIFPATEIYYELEVSKKK